MSSTFTITAQQGAARTGFLTTAHGVVPTPCFMPIATIGAVHHITPDELRAAGATMVLANTYHLALRPGTSYLASHGGLQNFMGWHGPLLTDSGGFQVFSLGARTATHRGRSLVTLTEDGVRFRSHLDGSLQILTPELAMEHQQNIGSDIAMVLDVCPPQPCSDAVLAEAMALTTAWAARAITHAERIDARPRMLLFGIVQGGSHVDTRRAHAAAITALPFDGYAIGGVAVGEPTPAMRVTVECTVPLLPQDRPRYLMGVGTPADIVHAVQCGVDLFDCVLPTRDARHGRVYRWTDRREFPDGHWYETINIHNATYRDQDAPIDPLCPCVACRTTSLAYLRHLMAIREPLGGRLLTLHNLTFYLGLLQTLRECIAASTAVAIAK
ncbi:tRNA guanosine(34) transglycosylase Tgt [Candidatus Uhrbacteria bacterium]|nr:tRNA guanosine(34) transglycosylase Tgt [Candidatus Uhrbacteria bacterium]